MASAALSPIETTTTGSNDCIESGTGKRDIAAYSTQHCACTRASSYCQCSGCCMFGDETDRLAAVSVNGERARSRRIECGDVASLPDVFYEDCTMFRVLRVLQSATAC